jgi:hypothetical protein
VFLSLLAGLCCLVPIPFLDDHLRNRVRRHMVTELARHQRVNLDHEGTLWLAVGAPRTLRSLARGCLTGTTLKPVLYFAHKLFRSTFRKFLYFLAVKDAADTFSITFHQGWLIDHALAEGHVSDTEQAARVWRAIDAVCRDVDPRPLEAGLRTALRGSRATLVHAARMLARATLARDCQDSAGDELDTQALAAEESLLDEVVDELDDRVASAGGHLAMLVVRYRSAHSAVQPQSERENSQGPVNA